MPRERRGCYPARMAAPAWFWPPSGAWARGTSLAFYAGGMAVADWTAPRIWPFANGAFAPAIGPGSGVGFPGCATDPSSGLWALSYDGHVYHIPANGIPALLAVLPQPRAYAGIVLAGTTPYGVGADGTVWTAASTLLTTFGSVPSVMPVAVPGASYSFAALLPGISSIGTCALPGGVTGAVATPAALAVPSCLTAAASGSVLGVGGWSPAPPLSGATSLAADPVDPTHLLAVSGGVAMLWSTPAVESQAWTQSQALTGISANAGFVTWVPNGTQALLSDSVAGGVQVLNYAGTLLSLAQSLSVMGATAIGVTPDSNYALVCRPAAGRVQPLANSDGTWSLGTVVSGIFGAASVAVQSTTQAVVACSGGLVFLNLNLGVWVAGGIIPPTTLGFTPTLVTLDAFGLIYAAGATHAAMLSSGGTFIASGSWTGASAAALLVDQGRICVLGSGALYVLGQSGPATLAMMASAAVAVGVPSSLAIGGLTTLFTADSNATLTWSWSGTPYLPSRVVSGAVGILTLPSTWATGAMSIGHTPSAVAFDTSGNLWVSTPQNDLWSFSPAGAVLTSGVVSQYAGQPQSVPLGVSALLVSGGHVYAATSMSGVLIEAT